MGWVVAGATVLAMQGVVVAAATAWVALMGAARAAATEAATWRGVAMDAAAAVAKLAVRPLQRTSRTTCKLCQVSICGLCKRRPQTETRVLASTWSMLRARTNADFEVEKIVDERDGPEYLVKWRPTIMSTKNIQHWTAIGYVVSKSCAMRRKYLVRWESTWETEVNEEALRCWSAERRRRRELEEQEVRSAAALKASIATVKKEVAAMQAPAGIPATMRERLAVLLHKYKTPKSDSEQLLLAIKNSEGGLAISIKCNSQADTTLAELAMQHYEPMRPNVLATREESVRTSRARLLGAFVFGYEREERLVPKVSLRIHKEPFCKDTSEGIVNIRAELSVQKRWGEWNPHVERLLAEAREAETANFRLVHGAASRPPPAYRSWDFMAGL